jgi:enterochelin esterase-like enzyme
VIVRLITLLMLACAASSAATAPQREVPVVSSGRIVDLGVLRSKFADPRRVVVWLPDGYSSKRPPYAVLYMHDGQNLFDKETAAYGMEWGIDETLERLIAARQVRPTIVVGIWNTPKRLREYVPRKAFERLAGPYMDRVRGLYGGDPLSDGYLKFIVRELKPRIDARFNVRRDAANTVIMGSSMGALISLYAIDEYPAVFGGAGMMSTHWPLFLPKDNGKLSDAEVGTVVAAFEAYLRPHLASPCGHRLYFDHGTETLDAQYAAYQARIDRVVTSRGYRPDVNWMVRSYPGQKHNEISWASRVDVPLLFLLPPYRRSK